MKPLLQFAPHEMDASNDVHNDALQTNENEYEFRGQWLGGEDDFLVRTTWLNHNPAIFFKLKNQPERGNFVCCPKYYYPDKPEDELIYNIPHHLEPEQANELLPIYANRPWGRLWYLDEDWNLAGEKPAQWRLFLTFSGWGELIAGPPFDQTDSLFRWKPSLSPTSLAELAPSELLELFRPELFDSQSDAAFVRRFGPLPWRERAELCRPLQCGDYSEWHHVLVLFGLSRTKAWKSDHKRASFRSGSEAKPFGIYNGMELLASADKFYRWTEAYF